MLPKRLIVTELRRNYNIRKTKNPKYENFIDPYNIGSRIDFDFP